MTSKQRKQKMADMNDKYTRLLWYARVSSSDKQLPRVNKDGKLIDFIDEHMKEIEELYPEETKALSGEHANWQHGFNSGIVAASRYFLSLSEKVYGEDAELIAEGSFPDLDS
jgi:hypothetical protein